MPTASKPVPQIPKPAQPLVNDDNSMDRTYYRLLQELLDVVRVLRTEIP